MLSQPIAALGRVMRHNCALLAVMLLPVGCTPYPASDSLDPTPSSFAHCIVSSGSDPDSDADGLPDSCEAELARTFAPVFIVRSGGCNWDLGNARLGGGYFYAVQPVDSLIRIAYLPAYFEDCGFEGPKCWIPGVNCSPHAGDSEFIVVELPSDSTRQLRVNRVFLSAHCFGRSGGDCRWYSGVELVGFTWRGASPEIWVAEGKNANYPSRAACDRGHNFIDTCDNNQATFRFPVIDGRNLGSRIFPHRAGGCVAGRELDSAIVDSTAVECFWRPDSRFRGWRSAEKGVTGYYRYLVEIAGFQR